jgi:hypothetical protein
MDNLSIGESGYALGSSKLRADSAKPENSFTTRSLRSLETRRTQRKPFDFIGILRDLCASVVQASNLDGAST